MLTIKLAKCAVNSIIVSVLLLNSQSLYAEQKSDLKQLNQALIKESKRWQTQFNLPSLVVAVRHKDKMLVNHAQGFANIEQQIKATPSTTYSVGSIAKSMSSLAMARLIDKGQLRLIQPIKVYGDYQKSWQELTIKQLASHTAGIVHYNKARELREFNQIKDHWQPSEALDVFSHEPLSFKPGSQFQYSSSGYILLSDVLAKASNMPYLQLMQQEVFAPLDMGNTLFDSKDAFNSREASYYQPALQSTPRVLATTHRDRSFLFGGGAYQSTAEDLVSMTSRMFKTGYLSESSKKQLFTPVTLSNGKNNPQNYALGWRVHDMDVSQYIPGKQKQIIKGIHHGGTVSDAANAYVLTFPEFDLSMAYTTNSIPRSEDKHANLQVQIWLWLYKYSEVINQL